MYNPVIYDDIFGARTRLLHASLNKKAKGNEDESGTLKNDISRGQKRVKSNNELNDTMCNIYRVVQLVKLFQRDYSKRGVSAASPASNTGD